MTIRTPSLPSYVPSFFTDFSDHMTFSQRLINAFIVANMFLFGVEICTNQEKIDLVRQYAPGYDSLQDVVRKVDLCIQTRDYLLEYPEPTMPNVIMLPGVTPDLPKPLQEPLLTLMEGSEHGVVLVSFSSISNFLPEAILLKMFEAFRSLPQEIVMRHTGDIDKAAVQAPGNVHLFHWLPLNDLLGHNNTKAFVTHCGNNARYESVYHSVPMVAMPFFLTGGQMPRRLLRWSWGSLWM